MEQLKEIKIGEKFIAINRITKENYRCYKETETTIFVFAKGKSRYGRRFLLEDFYNNYSIKIKTEEQETATWHKRLKRAIKCMETSGLWETIKEKYQNLLTITLAEKNLVRKEYWEKSHKSEYAEFLRTIKAKHPFMIKQNEDGEDFLDTDYIWELSECNLKSMYFGAYKNDIEKENIKRYIENKKDYNTTARTNYDVSFQYRADAKKAWYSEEYKNCGNGHYYLALDHNTALFCEND